MTTTTRPDPQRRPRARFLMADGLVERFFDEEQLARLGSILDISTTQPLRLPVNPAETADVEVLITGWGAPSLGEAELDALPQLRGILHAAGTVKSFLVGNAWRRGIRVTSAAAANALPVAEFTLAAILFAGKAVFEIADQYRREPETDFDAPRYAGIGNYRRTVGIIGASQIGRRVIELLRPFDIDVFVSDPYLAEGDPILGHSRAVPLDELFRRCDVVSIHAPALPETEGLASAERLASMPRGATVVNTARASLIDQDALIEAVSAGRIRAVLDVSDPEPVPADHPLRSTPGILLTPHLAGAKGNELHRLGEAVIVEASALVDERPAVHPVRRETLGISA